MENLGFYISKLSVKGKDLQPAELSFEKGFNLITGLSDTGKSYAFSCLNFMLGQESQPKSIPESTGYSDVYLEIKTYTDDVFSLYRKFSSKSYILKKCAIDDFHKSNTFKELKLKHDKDNDDNISSFLLSLCGLKDVVLKKSKSENVSLSFRHLRKLTFIPEDRIITENSPFYSTLQNTNQTTEQFLLFYLLTGIDAKDILLFEDEKVRKGRISGQLDFIENQIKKVATQLDELSLLKDQDKINSFHNR